MADEICTAAEKMGTKHWYQVNKRLLPYKLHHFLLTGGLAGIAPFMPLIAKHIGINATAVGVGYSVIPVFIFLSNPLFGLLVDYFQNLKVFLILLLITTSVSYFLVLLIPPIEHAIHAYEGIRIVNLELSHGFTTIPMYLGKICTENILNMGIDCRIFLKNGTHCDNWNFTSAVNVSFNQTLSHYNVSADEKFRITFITDEVVDKSCINDSVTEFHCIPTLDTCLIKEENTSIYYAQQFWLYMVLATLASVTNIAISTLSSAATLEALGKNTKAYGKQKVFGTIGWGLACLLSGLLNDMFSDGSIKYLPGIYLMSTCFSIDLINICLIHIPKANFAQNICSDLRTIFTSMEIMSFAFGVIVLGLLNSIIYSFEFWFLQDMGASQFLLGMVVAFQCFIGELPCMFFSGWLLNKLGHFVCMLFAFAGTTLRLALYSTLKNPWHVLPIDILHGLTSAVFHTAVMSYAKFKAPIGLEATMLTMFQALNAGLGSGIGSFLGGVGIDVLGPRCMFSSASILGGATFLIFLVASYFFRGTSRQRRKDIPAVQLELEGYDLT